MTVGSVLVTGASRGVGLELVRQLAKLPTPPCHIFATCRHSEIAKDLHEFSRQNKAVSIIDMDVNDTGSIQFASHLVEQELEGSGLNLLINNASFHPDVWSQNLSQVTPATMMDMYRTNVLGPLLVTRAFLPLLRTAAKKGRKGLGITKAAIVNVSSQLSSMTENTGGMYSYRASKAALNMVTSCLSKDLENDDIIAVPLHPGHVRTYFGDGHAQITSKESAKGLLNIMAYLNEHKNGQFFDYRGKHIAW